MAKQKIKKALKIDSKKVGDLLKSLNDAEYVYMKHCMDFRDALKKFIDRHELTKEFICEKFKVSEKQFKDYLLGAYNYSVKDFAILNALYVELEAERLEESAPIQITGSQSKKKK